jgi:hypothetical protein
VRLWQGFLVLFFSFFFFLVFGFLFPSESVDLMELSVAGIMLLGFYVLLDFFVFFFFFFFFLLLLSRSSSSPSVVSLCSFSFSLGPVLGLALGLICDDNRMGGVFLFFT